jgi:hypothetical protein
MDIAEQRRIDTNLSAGKISIINHVDEDIKIARIMERQRVSPEATSKYMEE